MTVRTRFAPSPTGYLHIGGVRTALYNWLFAKQAGGQFLLRIDDTDQQRNVEAALKPILDGFRWLGLNWDEGPDVGGPHEPYFQSQRSDRHREAAEQLLKSGHAYKDYSRPEELQTQREAAEKEGRAFVYDRRWMASSPEDEARFEAEGRTFVVRLKMPREGKCRFDDLIRGTVEFDWAAEQDHVIQRNDGTCLYHLASVVDDFDFQITHVIRAVEHLPNTPRQIFIAQSLGYALPYYAHLPYVAEPGGTAKLSKRKLDKYLKQEDFKSLFQTGQSIAEKSGVVVTPETFNPVVIDFYREIGFLPDAILNYLLLVGWSLDDSTEHFTREEMIKHFSLERVNKAPASFDPQKLVAFQHRWMQSVDLKKKVALVLPFLQRAGWVSTPAPCDIADRLNKIVTAAADRIKIAGDILQFDEFFSPDDQLVYNATDFDKRIRNAKDAVELLSAYREALAQLPVDPATPAEYETHLKSFLEAKGLKIGAIIHALRVAVTGKSVGCGMFESIEIIGRHSAIRRIDRAVSLAK